MTENRQLLANYVANGSEASFRELVMGYTDLVYSTALRLVDGDTHRAEDVAQTVFTDLARIGRTLPSETMIGGWLHRHTCFVARKTMRGERRRRERERLSVEMNAMNDAATDLAQIAPVLDEAINQLKDEDRQAILLRFYERHDLRKVGEMLGASENAAQKRVSRALEQLHSILTRRGVILSVTGLAGTLAGGVVTGAPTGLAISLAATALSGAATGAGTTFTFFKLMTMTKLKVAIAAMVVAGVTTHVVLQHQAQEKFRTTGDLLRERDAQLATLALESQRLSNLVARSIQTVPNGTEIELARLRAEVGALKRELADARQAQSNSLPVAGSVFSLNGKPGEFRSALTNSPNFDYAKALGLAFRLYASDNGGQFPTNLTQVESLISASEAAPQEVRDLFEFVNQGSMEGLTNAANTIIVREKQPRGGPGSLWTKTYVFADGHVETQSKSDASFDAWEQMHMIPPEQQSSTPQ